MNSFVRTKLKILGGEGEDGSARKDVYQFDRETESWKSVLKMLHPRTLHSVSVVDNWEMLCR